MNDPVYQRYELTELERSVVDADPTVQAWHDLGVLRGFDPETVKQHANTGPLMFWAVPT
jgi:hypothetical protein